MIALAGAWNQGNGNESELEIRRSETVNQHIYVNIAVMIIEIL